MLWVSEKTLDTFRIARGKSVKCTNGKIRQQCRVIKADTVGIRNSLTFTANEHREKRLQ